MDLIPVIGFVRTWWKAGLIGLAVSGLCLALGYCEGRKAGKASMQVAIERANNEALQQKARADELAADRRLADTIAVNRQEEALRDAIETTPDTNPDAVRVQLGCARLRASGTSGAALPAVCRSGG